MKDLLRCSLIFGILMAWTTISESKLSQYCPSMLIKPEPILIKTEQQMRGEGYGEKYIAGLDHTRSNLQLVDQLRRTSIDPRTSHIEEFAHLIDTHISFIERGILSQNHDNPQFSSDKALRLQQLERLKSEAQSEKNLGRVTYRWWFLFNLRLAIVATSWVREVSGIRESPLYKRDPLNLLTNDGIKEFFESLSGYTFLLDNFPKRILIPTIQNLGYIAINETYGTGVHLIGLVNDKRFDMLPIDFILHDIDHARFRNIDRSQIAKRVMLKKASLPKPHRELIEFMFFDATHEMGRTVYKTFYYYVIEGERRYTPMDSEETRKIISKFLKDSFWESHLSYLFPWLRI